MTKRLEGLEAVRGVAALVVAYGHVAVFAPAGYYLPFGMVAPWLGMDLFFLLSGYVLSRRFATGLPPAADFVALRFKRLWLPVACGVVIGAAVLWHGGMATIPWSLHLAGGLAILPVGGMILFNGPAWSVHFELWANFFHALILKSLSVFVLATIVIACAVIVWLGMQRGPLEEMGQGPAYGYGFARVLLSYTLGMIVWRLTGDKTVFKPSHGWIALAAYVVLLAYFASWMRGTFELAIVLIGHPLVMLACLSIHTSRIANWLGAFSFPLYAIHYPVLFGAATMRVDPLIGFAIAVASAAILGLAVDPRWRQIVFGRGARAKVPIVGMPNPA